MTGTPRAVNSLAECAPTPPVRQWLACPLQSRSTPGSNPVSETARNPSDESAATIYCTQCGENPLCPDCIHGREVSVLACIHPSYVLRQKSLRQRQQLDNECRSVVARLTFIDKPLVLPDITFAPVPKDNGWISGNPLLPTKVVITGTCRSRSAKRSVFPSTRFEWKDNWIYRNPNKKQGHFY